MKAVWMVALAAGLFVLGGGEAAAVVPSTAVAQPAPDPAAGIKIKDIDAKYDPRKKDVAVKVKLEIHGKANTKYYVQLAASDGKNAVELAGDHAVTTDAKGKALDVTVTSNRAFLKPGAKITFIAGLTAEPVLTNPNQKALSTDSKSETLPDGKKK